ncbi:DUF1631 domain-containing protein [Halioxenophilus aromaticivorans]|uniref:DUF1631 domain-containing protein n=1 Tax=Halioxenophilus aromaticivorans TaxID=1306992 RepID=A0AAV3TYY4_9ALTE
MSDSSQRQNVIDLRSATKARQPQSSVRLPAAVHLLKEKATYMLQSSLLGLFDSADDTLFELADKSDNNQDQNTYFESMRQVRLARREIETRFISAIHQAFDGLVDLSASSQENWDYDVDLDNLSLVNNDQLEQNVAVEAMVNAAIEHAPESLQHLTLRLDSLVPVKVYQRNNPIGPHQICTAFMHACEHLDTNIKVKLVLLKLFDRHLVRELAGFYELANELMIARNILPSLSTQRRGRPVPRSPGRPSGSSGQAGGRAGDGGAAPEQQTREVLETFRNLVATGSVGVAAQPGQGPTTSTTSNVNGSGVVISEATLLQLLTQLQEQQSQSHELAASGIDIQQLQNMVQARHQAMIGQLDRDVISLINLLFEFIVQDRNLAAEMKALLSRLQIPLLKIAIADKTFFDHSGHPAKRLLNELATAALGWVPNQPGRDNLFGKIEFTVSRICNEANANAAVFDEMLMEFLAFTDKEKKQAAILEKRTLDAEAGKAKAEAARADVASVLSKLKDVDKLSAPMKSLVHEAWANVMFLIALKDGVDSPQWNSSHSTVRNLVWSLTVEVTSLNRVRLIKLLPELLKRLRAGLESIGYNAYDTGKLFKALEAEHIEQLRNKQAGSSASRPAMASSFAPETEPATAPAKPQSEPALGREQAPLAGHPKEPSQVPVLDDVAPVVETRQQPAQAPAKRKPAFVDLTEPVEDAEIIESSLSAEPEPQFLEQVDNLSQGSWFELRDGESQVRCRLAAIIKPTGKYIFVNRNGMKVAEQERRELALNIRSGRVRMLDNSMLFDRALESVISNLRQSREEQNR